MMSNFAQELQATIIQAQAWNAMSKVEKAVDIFVKEVKKNLMLEASRGVEIDDMAYVVCGYTFDNMFTAFHQAYRCSHYPSVREMKKFKKLLEARMFQEGLKFEFRKGERTEIVTMRFTAHTDEI
jgi:hypothetical protein